MSNSLEPRSDDPAQDQATPPRPAAFWSPWATTGWGVFVAVVFVLVQMAVMALWAAIRLSAEPDLDPRALLESSGQDGGLFALSTLATSIICSALLWLIVRLKRGADPQTALALVPPLRSQIGFWLAITAGLIVISDTLTIQLGKPIVPEFMTDVFRASSSPALLGFAIIFGAPIFEELFFRGFLLEGLRRGPTGEVGAVVICSACWAAVHLQYGVYEITSIFVFGLVLGAARIKSGSLWVPIAMHILANLVATLETMVVLRSIQVLPI